MGEKKRSTFANQKHNKIGIDGGNVNVKNPAQFITEHKTHKQ